MKKGNLTLVTALFDIGRGDLPDSFRRDFSHYLQCFSSFLQATKAYPLVVFIEAKNEYIVWENRSRDNTSVIIKELDFLKSFPFHSQVQETRTRHDWLNQAGWLADSPQAALELYNPLIMSKQFMLNDATLYNMFDTKYFLWLDAGLTNTVNLQQYLDAGFEKRVTQHMNKMLYLCFPYDGQVEVHGFPKKQMNRYAGQDTTYVARGGCFGGSKDAINTVNDIYYNLLSDTLNSGYMGTEESIFTLITYRNPDKCNVRMIESNGFVSKFFEDISQKPTGAGVGAEAQESIAIYTLTYNLPQQFKLFAESFRDAYPADFKTAKKYVINNSNVPEVEAAYAELFAEYGFEEFKFDNIGINNGRQFAAEHFNNSGHEYMIFFEDDMLLHPNNNKRCKSGFTCWQHDLFDKATTIMSMEGLDYLKLSFSEFYGDNNENWAWYNVPMDKKDVLFPKSDDRPERKTKIEYTGTHRGLTYAVGQFHYCNWPLVFNKEGNRKVFLDIKWEHLYEQTLMSNTMMQQHEGNVRAGCLLASPINHERRFHYDGTTRRENKNYKN